MSSSDNIKAKIPLNVAIIGAGIGGLAAAVACTQAGIRATVYETATQITEVGAGIQVGPNMARVLRRWNLLDALRPHVLALDAISLRRYADDSELTRVPMTEIEKIHGAPVWVAHRADLLDILKRGAEVGDVKIVTGSWVEDVDFENARLKIKNSPHWIEHDVIIAADGVKSTVRKKMLAVRGDIDKARETGDAAWRVVVSAEQIYKTKDVGLIEALEDSVGLRWIGPESHIMCYPFRNHQLLNMVLIHPDKIGTEESWTTKGNKKDMLEFFKKWNSRVRKLVDCVPEGEILEWKLCDHEPLATWVEGKVALTGDAVHPMLPYVAQSAAQAVEDGAVLGICLAMVDNKDQINTALKVYELVRKERAEVIQASAAQVGYSLHLPDGKEQQDRDEIIRNVSKGGPNPDLWSDKSFQHWCWSTDTSQQAFDMWDELVQLVTSGQSFESPFNTKNLPWLQKIRKLDFTIHQQRLNDKEQ